MAGQLDTLTGPEVDADRPETARVVRTGPAGIYVAVLNADTRSPIGPCRGPAAADVDTNDVVLLAWTDDGPWIAAVDRSGTA